MMEGDNKIDVAYFEVNAHGRILSGNRRFCRMFGYSESEVVWHYITDFYRYLKEWEDFRDCVDEARHSFVARMRNRKGRSFKCSVTREVVQDSEGHVTFRRSVTRPGEKAAVAIPEVPTESKTLVFVTRCAHCGLQVRVNTPAETRMRVLCDNCAVKAYPEAFNLAAGQV